MTVDITVHGGGACCIWPDTCQIMTEDECTAAGGIYQGDGTDCGAGQVTVIDATGLGLSIPEDGYPGAGASHTLNMPDSFVLQDADIDVQISHTWTGDLIVEVSHLGTTVVIVNQPGDATDTPGSPFGCSDDNYDIILDDEGAGGTIAAQCLPNLSSPPNYTPNNPLSAFDGMDSAGGWTIDVFDSAGGDTGTLDGWSVHMEGVGGGAGPCEGVCCETPVTTYPYCEGFESGFGEWTNATEDDFDWTRQSGSTPSNSPNLCDIHASLLSKNINRSHDRSYRTRPASFLSPLCAVVLG